MGRLITSAKVGTAEDWLKHRNKLNVHIVIPATFYADEYGGIYLVTTEEWKNYFLGKSNKMPDAI